MAQWILSLNPLNHPILGYVWRLSGVLGGHFSYILPSVGSNMFRLSAANHARFPTIVQRENRRPAWFMVQRARFLLILPQINPHMQKYGVTCEFSSFFLVILLSQILHLLLVNQFLLLVHARCLFVWNPHEPVNITMFVWFVGSKCEFLFVEIPWMNVVLSEK